MFIAGRGADPVAVAFSAGNFTGNNSMTWTVAAGDQNLFEYAVSGGWMRVRARIITATVGGTPDTTLQITIPNSSVSAEAMEVLFPYMDNSTTTWADGVASVTNGGTLISLKKFSGNWTASTDQTNVTVDMLFRIR